MNNCLTEIFFFLPIKKGFKLRRKRGRLQNRLVCLDNGVWAPPRKFDYPYCEIIQCTRPKNILHGRLLPQVRNRKYLTPQCGKLKKKPVSDFT